MFQLTNLFKNLAGRGRVNDKRRGIKNFGKNYFLKVSKKEKKLHL
jgi:hypothetical protein